MKSSEFNEDIIIAGCKRDDRQSQELLYRHFARKMYAICLSYAGDRSLAKDMLQDAFIKIFKNIRNYKKDGSFEGWIRRIITNTAIDHLRQKKRTDNYVKMEVKMEVASNMHHTKNLALSRISFNEVMEQVERLPEGARIIFNLYALDGYTHKEIAQKLSISEGTSKSQFNRARKLLMNFLFNLNM